MPESCIRVFKNHAVMLMLFLTIRQTLRKYHSKMRCKLGSQKLKGRPREILSQPFWRGQPLGRPFEINNIYVGF